MELVAQGFEAADLEAAVELCYQQRWTDGLPVIPPTRGAVERIINYIKRDPKEVVGIIAPRDGIATIEAIAINCVMAGCKPEYVPIVITAIEAICEEQFNLNGVQTTTHSCAPLVIVSGPAVKQLGFNTKECAFGHGCRPSATIGRAVRLVLWNVGAGIPGEPCKTTLGHPGYYSFCVAEDADANPWEGLNVEYGFTADDTLVTVASVEGPRLVGTGGGYSPAEDVMFMIADSIAMLGCNNIAGGDLAMVMSPMAAKNLSSAGLSKADVKRGIARLATRAVRDVKRRRSISEDHPMHWSKIADPNNDDALFPFVRSVDNLIMLVAGGWGSGGAFCAVCPGWGANRSRTVRRRVVFPA
jgi:hypothetical protein